MERQMLNNRKYINEEQTKSSLYDWWKTCKISQKKLKWYIKLKDWLWLEQIFKKMRKKKAKLIRLKKNACSKSWKR